MAETVRTGATKAGPDWPEAVCPEAVWAEDAWIEAGAAIGVSGATAMIGLLTAASSMVEKVDCVAALGTPTGAMPAVGMPSSAARNNEATKGSRVRRIAALTSTPDNLSRLAACRIRRRRYVTHVLDSRGDLG